MAILADTYKALDKEFDVGYHYFTREFQPKVYSIADDIKNTILDFNFDKIKDLDKITGQLSSMLNDIKNLPVKIIDQMKSVMNKVVDDLLDLPFVGFARDVLDDLKSLDNEGLRSFVGLTASVGGFAMCGNLDVFQGLLNGFEIPQSVLEGMFLTVTLDWMDRVCKSSTPEQEANMDNYQRLETTNPYGGIETDTTTIVKDFIGTSGAYLRNLPDKIFKQLSTFSNDSLVIEKAGSDDYKYYVRDLQEIITPSLKEQTLDIIDNELDRKYKANELDKAYYNLLNSRGMVGSLPGHNRTMVMKSNNLGRSQDALGFVLKKLGQIDLGDVSDHMLDEEETRIYHRLFEVKGITSTVDYLSRTFAYRQFEGYRFDEVFSVFENEELEYLSKADAHPDSHRWNGMSTTAEIFIDPKVKYKKKTLPIASPVSQPSSGKEKPPVPEYLIP